MATTDDSPKRARSASPRGAGRTQADSFLLRLWQEPREAPGEPSRLRGYARNLRSGEERYVTDLEQLCEFLGAQLGLRRTETERAAGAPLDEEFVQGL